MTSAGCTLSLPPALYKHAPPGHRDPGLQGRVNEGFTSCTWIVLLEASQAHKQTLKIEQNRSSILSISQVCSVFNVGAKDSMCNEFSFFSFPLLLAFPIMTKVRVDDKYNLLLLFKLKLNSNFEFRNYRHSIAPIYC